MSSQPSEIDTNESREDSQSEASYDGASVFDEEIAPPNSDMNTEVKHEPAKPEDSTMRAELKHLDQRFTTKGKAYTIEIKDDIVEATVDWWQRYALCVTRVFDRNNKRVLQTSLQVNSTHLKDLLKDIIKHYPGISFQTKDVKIQAPYHCLYHHRQEIKDAASRFEPGSEALEHLQTLISFINEQFADCIAEGANLREQGLTSYEHLWNILRPGCIVVSCKLGQQSAFKLESYEYVNGLTPSLRLHVTSVDFDGDAFGTRHIQLSIPFFRNAVKIADLNVYPLTYAVNASAIQQSLTARGRIFESLAGQHLRTYQHVALDSYTDEDKLLRFTVEGRVMIDCKTFHRYVTDDSYSVQAFPHPDAGQRELALRDDWDLLPQETAPLVPLSDDQCLLASATVRGFSFSEKKFLDFFVDKLSPIEWNSECFEQLVLPSTQKELVQALVSEHSKKRGRYADSGFDDIVKGKGRGLVLVLHGPPGVGKTLTAECVAEFTQRPLYIVSSGELGTSCESLDERLTRILDMASTWNAILLIDEADVFLERRALNDMERNGLVSIFLRVLEYYQGILFMTTNRVRTFDDAFKSRIHVPLKYGELPESSRKQIWRNFLAKVDGGVDLDEPGYDTLCKGVLNGRQIKNVVRTAKSLASHKGNQLDLAQLQQVMEIQMAFERDLNMAEGDIDAVEQ